jgi:hypothetical protein
MDSRLRGNDKSGEIAASFRRADKAEGLAMTLGVQNDKRFNKAMGLPRLSDFVLNGSQ